ncbi:hypothetical protein CANCADRAFT_14634, partial [Tortispora caseinolytica NRRL Y-17796]
LIEDRSTNGTWVNVSKLQPRRLHLLVHGDEICIAPSSHTDQIRFIFNCPNATQPSSILLPELLNKYHITETVGSGAFAKVLKAVHRQSGITYAVKAIQTKLPLAANAIEREISVLMSLHHPNIVALHETYKQPSHTYLILDYVPNGDLMDHILNAGPLSERDSSSVLSQILDAIHYVHSRGISHRDLKPENILIQSLSPIRVKVCDFGLAKANGPSSLLKTFCGTFAYLAPEILQSRSASPTSPQKVYSNAVDIWSIGCIAYVSLTASFPFNGVTQDEMHRSIVSATFLMAPLKQARTSQNAIDFLSFLLQPNPEKRPTALSAMQHVWLLGNSSVLSEIESSDNNAY